jgi:hypothetical protein
MQLLRPHLIIILLIGITTLLAACGDLQCGKDIPLTTLLAPCSSDGGDGNDDALEFFDDFESTNVVTVASFNLSHNGITATVAGGTAFTIGNLLLYHSGDNSWMVEPAGVNIRGTHTGTGTITFSVPMSRISFWVRGDPGNTSMVTILDVDGNMAENSSITPVVDTGWTKVDFTRTSGSLALKSIKVEASGIGMAALDDLGGNSE